MTANDPTDIPEDILTWMRGLVTERGPVPMSDRIFRHAREYHECALRCLELRGGGQTFLFMPGLVLLAFSIEIYIKGLLVHEGNSSRGHQLEKLYGELSGASRKAIAIRYSQRHRGRDIEADLPAYSQLFVSVRYSYELDHERTHDITGVGQLASSLYELWADLRPDLVVGGVVHERIIATNQGIPVVES